MKVKDHQKTMMVEDRQRKKMEAEDQDHQKTMMVEDQRKKTMEEYNKDSRLMENHKTKIAEDKN
jgi:hypothetical protein